MFKRFIITGPDGKPYLERTYLLDTRWGGLYLHKILVSDPDRDLHDHPWKFVSFLLGGFGYYEHQAVGAKKFIAPWRFNRRTDAAAPHRLELTRDPTTGEERTQWTLVFVGKKEREWGFHIPRERAAEHGFPPSGSRRWDEPAIQAQISSYVPHAVWVDHVAYLNVKFPNGWQKEPGYYEKPILGGNEA